MTNLTERVNLAEDGELDGEFTGDAMFISN